MSHAETEKARPAINVPRLVVTILVIFAAAAGAYWYGVQSVKPPAVPGLWALGLDQPSANRLDEQFQDEDGNLIADPPKDSNQWLDPETLRFSYLAANQEHYAQVMASLLEYLSEQCGRPVVFAPQESPDDQLAGLKKGELHIVGINSGAVPVAVNQCGFVPLSSFGTNDRLVTYTMKFIVRKDSPVKSVADLRGHRLALTDPTSNSGWKAPLMLLKNEHGLTPIVDYDIASTGSHENSIKAIAAGDEEAAAVASDELQLAQARGLIAADDFRVVYESEPFCNNTIGCPYNLHPLLVEKVRAALLELNWEGSKLADEFSILGATQFVAVSFKDDFKLIRQIDDAMGRRTREMFRRPF
jgi:phosphonate transport system substrate-binding protein